jgi:hypothetical protein
MNTYKIDPELCPNVSNEKYFKNLRYLVYRRYVENSITYEPWQELVLECLINAQYLIESFFDLLADHNDKREMCVWLEKLHREPNTLPEYVNLGSF